MATHQTSVAVIIVHPTGGYYHSALCLQSMRSITYDPVEIIVVDNGSSDDSVLRLREEFPEMTFIRSEINEGFAGGNNIGIEYACQHGSKHILLLNNDTAVTPSFIEPLLERLESDPQIAAVSGKIYYHPLAVGGRENIIWYAGAEQKWHMGYTHKHQLEEDKGQCDIASEVAYASGCMMLMRGEVLKKIGGLSEDYFMYWEESDWCMRARESGFSSWYEPKSLIYHNVRSSDPGKESPLYTYMMFRNFLIYAKLYFHGLNKVRFWIVYPIHFLNRVRICLIAGNTKAAKSIFQGVADYFKGYKGKQGLEKRGLLI